MSIERLLWSEDATGLAEHVRRGDVQPRELVDAAIARAEKVNPEINAIAEPLFDKARAMALDVDQSAPFAGVPFAFKDLGIEMKGLPIHVGSRLPARVGEQESVLARRFLDAGFIPIATSTMPEQGLVLMTESVAFGITRNPWNSERTSGGSSGGSASLVAAGVVPAAHATDGGGSIRVPAACTGLVGMKPSRGRVPQTPIVSDSWFGYIADHVVTRSVRDSAAILDLIHGADLLAPFEARSPRGSFAAAAAREPGTLRLAAFRRSPIGLEVSAETHAALDAAIALAREAGHVVEEIDLPYLDRAFMADFCRAVSASIAGIMRAEHKRIGRKPYGELERSTRIVARFGEQITGGEVYAILERLQGLSRRLIADTAAHDAVLMPVIAHPPLKVGAMQSQGIDETLDKLLDVLRLEGLLRIDALFGKLMARSLWFTHWPAIQNVSGQPAIALPVHMTADGLPLGIQAVGRPGDEETLFRLAAQMERLAGWRERRAPLAVPS